MYNNVSLFTVSLPSQNNQHNQHEIRALFRPVRGTSTSGRIKKQKKRRTWTCEFICLSETDAMKVPTREEKLALVKAGLGSKKIQFNADDTEELFQQKLIGEDGFSKLSDCGGFEIMRCISNCRNLEVISFRRTPEVMKSFVGCQSKLYIRPIQRALSLEADNSLLTEASATITEKCCHCEQIIPIDELRDHVYTCVREKELCSDQIMNIVIECSSPHESQYYSDDLPDPEFDIYNAALTATNNTDQLTNSAIPVPRSNETVPVLEPPVIPSSSIASTAENSAETSRTEARTESYIQEPNANLVGSTGNSDSWKYETISNIIKFCSEKKIEDPIEILKIAQDKIIKGRKLELESESGTIEGATNFILVDRENLLETAFVEIKEIVDLRNTLEVQFYEENAVDLGGPRREFFTLVLRQIQEHYFDPVREYSDNYEIVGKILALSMLQSGPLPRVLSASLVEEVFNNSSPRAFVHDLRRGLDALCLYELACHLPTFIHLFTPRDRQKITLKLLTSTIKPQFSPEGSNRRQKESKIYAKYVKYLREAASGRRGDVTLAKILRFCTGSEEEPPLGYQIQPTMEFVERQSFLPTGNTCINKMQLTIPVNEEPTEDALFNFFDFAFCNSYFGLQ